MTCTRLSGRGISGIICTTPDFKPGDQAPDGYLAWHEWAEVQHKAGLRQKECGRCGKWKYPQELSDQIDRHEVKIADDGLRNCWTMLDRLHQIAREDLAKMTPNIAGER